jgi:hypothetical protein
MTKLSNIFRNNILCNVLKVGVILIILYLAIRIFTSPPSESSKSSKSSLSLSTITEGFETFIPANIIYGNEIIPTYTTKNNTCTFSLPSVSRLDTIRIYFLNSLTINETTPITLQYEDTNGNMHKIINDKATKSTQITMEFDGVDKVINLVPVLNEDGQYIYTNKIVLTIGDETYADLSSYIHYFDFYGRNRGDLSFDDFQQQLSQNNKNINPTDISTADNITKLTLDSDYLMYSMKLAIDKSSYPLSTMKPDTPYTLTVQYTNSIYPGQTLQVADSFKSRCDKQSFNSENRVIYLFFSKPIIANGLLITAKPISQSPSDSSVVATETSTLKLIFRTTPSLHSVYGNQPTGNDIQDFQRSAQTATSGSSDSLALDICPNMSELVDKQVQAQQLCDAIEYQDKIKAEKIRMDKNKQYLIKLKAQQDQIDQLNNAIAQLQNKRNARDQSNDMARVVRYQNQKASASTVRDLANQRLQSQDANSLYLNVNVK